MTDQIFMIHRGQSIIILYKDWWSHPSLRACYIQIPEISIGVLAKISSFQLEWVVFLKKLHGFLVFGDICLLSSYWCLLFGYSFKIAPHIMVLIVGWWCSHAWIFTVGEHPHFYVSSLITVMGISGITVAIHVTEHWIMLVIVAFFCCWKLCTCFWNKGSINKYPKSILCPNPLDPITVWPL